MHLAEGAPTPRPDTRQAGDRSAFGAQIWNKPPETCLAYAVSPAGAGPYGRAGCPFELAVTPGLLGDAVRAALCSRPGPQDSGCRAAPLTASKLAEWLLVWSGCLKTGL